MNITPENVSERPRLWNPNAAANWCLLLTPAFGAFLHAMNWTALGEKQRAKTNKIWAWVSIAFLSALILLPPTITDTVAPGRLIGLVLLLGWYFSQGRKQIKFVKKNYGNNYEKKPWAKPLVIGVGLVIGYIVLSSVFFIIYATVFGMPLE